MRTRANEELSRLQSELDALKQTQLRIHSDKIAIYRTAIETVASMLMLFHKHGQGRLLPSEAEASLDEFENNRLKLWGYLAMLAPQPVMDAQDSLMEYILEIVNGEHLGDWVELRTRAVHLLNEVRRDIGIDKSPIEYRGTR